MEAYQVYPTTYNCTYIQLKSSKKNKPHRRNVVEKENITVTETFLHCMFERTIGVKTCIKYKLLT